MNAQHDLDQQLSAFLREGPEELPNESFDAVRDRTEQTRQRVVIGPWRLPDMNKFVTYGLGAVAVVVLLFVGSQFFGEAGGLFGAEPTPTPTPEATLESTPEPTASPEPSPSPPPPLTQSFTSTLHGISLSYPEGWFSKAATEPWTGGQTLFREPPADFLYDPTLNDHLFLFIASQSIGDSTPDDWVAQQLAGYGCTESEPTTVDGATGLIGADCNVAAVTTDGRGYLVALYTSSDEPWLSSTYNRAWFDELLATVQLHPEDAVDSAS